MIKTTVANGKIYVTPTHRFKIKSVHSFGKIAKLAISKNHYLGIKSYRLIPFTFCLSTIFLILETSDEIIDDPRKDFSTFGISLGQCFTVIA